MIPHAYEDKTIAVMGLGKSGLAASRALAAAGATVWSWDDQDERRASASAEGVMLNDLGVCDWAIADALVLSPGIPHDFPAPHPVAAAASAAGCEIICDVELLFQTIEGSQTIGVTGTNGKSTTSALIGHILGGTGRPMQMGANLGLPVMEMDLLGPEGTYVLELSSYQLERVPSIALDVAVFLNISADHLDRHGGIEGYVAAKKHIFDNASDGMSAVVGMDDTHCRNICLELMVRGTPRLVPISGVQRVPGGVYVIDGILVDDLDDQQSPIVDLKTITALPGSHNWQNAAAAYAAARLGGVDPGTAVSRLLTFSGLPHRQEFIAEIDGIRFVNDSKATNTDSASRSVACYPSIYWIAGGQAKEDGLGAIDDHLENVQHAYLIGEAAEKISTAIDGRVPVTVCGELDQAFNAALEGARQAGTDGMPVVLLAPACASFDQFSDFEARGDAFRKLVEAV